MLRPEVRTNGDNCASVAKVHPLSHFEVFLCFLPSLNVLAGVVLQQVTDRYKGHKGKNHQASTNNLKGDYHGSLVPFVEHVAVEAALGVERKLSWNRVEESERCYNKSKNSLHKGRKEEADEKEVVSATHTVVNPGAMVVKVYHALVADVTMLRTLLSNDPATRTKRACIEGFK